LESKFVQAHVNAAAAEGDAFAFEPEALLHAGMAAQFDFTASANDAVPGDGAVRGTQGPGDLPRVPGESSGASHFTVGGHFASRNVPNGSGQGAERFRHPLAGRQWLLS